MLNVPVVSPELTSATPVAHVITVKVDVFFLATAHTFVFEPHGIAVST
jgi:hypothetical protein